MLGVVGKIRIIYSVVDKTYEDTFAISNESEFCLSHCKSIGFRIDEVTYIEDTIYGVVLSLINPYLSEDEYIVSSDYTEFSIDELGVKGTLSISV